MFIQGKKDFFVVSLFLAAVSASVFAVPSDSEDCDLGVSEGLLSGSSPSVAVNVTDSNGPKGTKAVRKRFLENFTSSTPRHIREAQQQLPSGDGVLSRKTVREERATSVTVKEYNVPKFEEILQLGTLHQDATGKGVKIGVIDGWFRADVKELKHKRFLRRNKNVLSVSARGAAISKKDDYFQTTAFNANRDNHANHIVSILHTIAPGSRMRVVDFQSEQGVRLKQVLGEANAPDHRVYAAAFERFIQAKEKPAFINCSVKFVDCNNDSGTGATAIKDGPLEPETKEAILRATDLGIGVVIGLANEGNSSQESEYVKSLFELARSPAAYGRVMLVAAAGYEEGGKERLASFSNRPYSREESQWVITAPGDNICARGAINQDVVKGGTSQAAPMVTGSAALLKSLRPEMSAERIFEILKYTSRGETLGRSAVFDSSYGMGLLCPTAALEAVRRERAA